MKRKETKVYYFSVEGYTEKWYLHWLQQTINATTSSKFCVKLDSSVQPDPRERVKRLSTMGKATVTHIVDVESSDDEYERRFQETLHNMKAAECMGKRISYGLGYSNYTFELWMILHKADCNGCLSHRNQYLSHLNKAYGENFENLSQYKQQANFERILRKLTLDDVRQAIQRAKKIEDRNAEEQKLKERYGYKYYDHNPSLSIWKIIEEILKDCGF